MPVNLLDFGLPQLADYVAGLGAKPFRARQLSRWIHQYGQDDFARMTDLGKDLRESLAAGACVAVPEVLREQVSADGTVKWLLKADLANAIETVFIPEPGRGTLCVSSQVGCALACTFCSTGRQGFNRNLTTAEIVGQLWWANRALGRRRPEDRPVTNVVMMGMGEPLANFDNVARALEVMLDDFGYGLSRRRVTVSTSGIVPAIDRLRERCPVALAVSLHAPNDALRDELVPINRKYPLAELMAACRRYVEGTAERQDTAPVQRKWQRDAAPRDFVTFEYVMLDGVNDRPQHAEELLELTRDVPCKFNLIPFNPFPDAGYATSSPASVAAFRRRLAAAGRVVTVRRTRGEQIDAACGQLAGKVADRSRRGQRLGLQAAR